MPELPEVETVVRELHHLEGKQPLDLEVHWDKTIEGDTSTFRKALKGSTIEKVSRRGKYIVFYLDGGERFWVHLRMTGKLIFDLSPKDLKHLRCTLEFSDGSQLHFVDIRKFGRWAWVASDQALLPQLGVEPLNAEDVLGALKQHKSRREIKKVLLDQGVLAGVGNIYADEALFRARIHPACPLPRVSGPKLKALAQAIPEILLASIDNMGTTLSDYRTTRNIGGENQNYLRVYGQTGQVCEACTSTIEKIELGGRGTHFCPRCQKKPRKR